MSDIADNINSIQETIKARSSEPVTLIGVTKFQPLERVKEALANGIRDLGVNYAQDGATLRSELSDPSLNWHFIGHIQSRKVKYLPEYQCIQSLDRLSVASSLNAKLKEPISVLIEMNLAGEQSKSGIDPTEAESFLDSLGEFTNLRVDGLMVMPLVMDYHYKIQKAKKCLLILMGLIFLGG